MLKEKKEANKANLVSCDLSTDTQDEISDTATTGKDSEDKSIANDTISVETEKEKIADTENADNLNSDISDSAETEKEIITDTEKEKIAEPEKEIITDTEKANIAGSGNVNLADTDEKTADSISNLSGRRLEGNIAESEEIVFDNTATYIHEENRDKKSAVVMLEKSQNDKGKAETTLKERIQKYVKHIDKKEVLLIYSFIIIAAFVRAMAMVVFANPNKVSAGGITGITTILVNYVDILKNASGILMFVFNLPLLILAFIFLNKKFAFYTIVETVITSLFIDLLQTVNFPTFDNDVFLAAICTGALNGFGLGLLLRANCSTGGNDIVGLLIQNKFPKVKVVWLILILDAAVAVSAGLVKQFIPDLNGVQGDGLATAIYSFIALFVNSFIAEKIQRGFVSSVKFEIVTSKESEVGHIVTDVFHRSATVFRGMGVYTQKPRTMIVAVVRKREAVALKKKIIEVDPKAFFYVSNIHEIIGNGFMVQVNASSKIK